MGKVLLALIHVAEFNIVNDETAGGLLVVGDESGAVLGDGVIDGLLHLDLETTIDLQAVAAGAMEGLEVLQGGSVYPLGSSPMAKEGGFRHRMLLTCSLYRT